MLAYILADTILSTLLFLAKQLLMDESSVNRLKQSKYMESNIEAIESFVSKHSGLYYYGKMGRSAQHRVKQYKNVTLSIVCSLSCFYCYAKCWGSWDLLRRCILVALMGWLYKMLMPQWACNPSYLGKQSLSQIANNWSLCCKYLSSNCFQGRLTSRLWWTRLIMMHSSAQIHWTALNYESCKLFSQY